MTTISPQTARALARSLEACRQHLIDVLVDLERAAAGQRPDGYSAAERALSRGLARLAQIADEAPALAAIADDATARQLRAAPEIFAAIAVAAANLPPRPEQADPRSLARRLGTRRAQRARRARSARTQTTITLDSSQ